MSTGRGAVVTVYSPRGGAGCTSIAVGVASAIASNTQSRVALVDLDLQFGDAHVFLGVNIEVGLEQLTNSIANLDPSHIQPLLVAHDSGVTLLRSPIRTEDGQALSPGDIRLLLAVMCTMFDLVVVNTSSHVDVLSMAVWEMSSLLLVVTSTSVNSVDAAKRFLELSRRLPALQGKNISLVINRILARDGVPLTDIGRSLSPWEVMAHIPESAADAAMALASGKTLSTPEAGALGHAVRQLASRVVPFDISAPKPSPLGKVRLI